MSEWISVDDRMPDEKQIVVFKAFNVDIGNGRKYTTDPYCGWVNCVGEVVGWPHNAMPPTHWIPIPELTKK